MKKFIKTKEDFVCERCGAEVIGNGYTNHCPTCLWSKHVDINPGDRAALCGGMMEPIGLLHTSGEQSIIQRCVKCKHLRKNKRQEEDDSIAITALSQRPYRD